MTGSFKIELIETLYTVTIDIGDEEFTGQGKTLAEAFYDLGDDVGLVLG